MAAGVPLFEELNLTPAYHTIKIVNKTGVIDVDYFAYLPATPEVTYTKVDALSAQITYSGTWNETHNDTFYMGNARAASEINAAAEVTFTGTAISWYGQTASETFGIASVYIDNEFVENAYTYGEPGTGKRIFEKTGLSEGEHTIRIVNTTTRAIDLDYLAFGSVYGPGTD